MILFISIANIPFRKIFNELLMIAKKAHDF